MKTIGPIDQKTALREYGIMRLAARIWDLKDSGWNIKKEKEEVRTRRGKTFVTKYSIIEECESTTTKTDNDSRQ